MSLCLNSGDNFVNAPQWTKGFHKIMRELLKVRKPANIPDPKRKGVLIKAIFHYLLSKLYLAVKQ